MSNDLTPFLLAVIAHGKPVFEIGYQLECPACCGVTNPLPEGSGYCEECKGEAVWWITNSGWRARPYWFCEVKDLALCWNAPYPVTMDVPDPPDDHPDLFQSYIDRTPRSSEPSSLLASLGMAKPKVPIHRRAVK